MGKAKVKSIKAKHIPRHNSRDSKVKGIFDRIVSELQSLYSKNLIRICSSEIRDDEFYVNIEAVRAIKDKIDRIRELPEYRKAVMILDILDGLRQLFDYELIYKINKADIVVIPDENGDLYAKISNYWDEAFNMEFEEYSEENDAENSEEIDSQDTAEIVCENLRTIRSMFWDDASDDKLFLFFDELLQNKEEIDYYSIIGKIRRHTLFSHSINLVCKDEVFAGSHFKSPINSISSFNSAMSCISIVYACRTSYLKWKNGMPIYTFYTVSEFDYGEEQKKKYISAMIEAELTIDNNEKHLNVKRVHSSYIVNNWVGYPGGRTEFVKKTRNGKKVTVSKYYKDIRPANELYFLPLSFGIEKNTANDESDMITLLSAEVKRFEDNLSEVKRKKKESKEMMDVWKSVSLLDYIYIKSEVKERNDSPSDEASVFEKQAKKQWDRRKKALERIGGDSELGILINDPKRIRVRSEVKENIIDRIMEAEKIFVLQGPPGTGKTKTIKDIVSRVIQEDSKAKILLTSQDHDALGHMYDVVKELDLVSEEDCYYIQKYNKNADGTDEKLEAKKEHVLNGAEEQLRMIEASINEKAEFLYAKNIETMSRQISEARKTLDRINRGILDSDSEADRSFYVMQRKKTVQYINDRKKAIQKTEDKLRECASVLSDSEIDALKDNVRTGNAKYESWKRTRIILERKREIIKDWIEMLKGDKDAFVNEMKFNHKIVIASCNKIGDYANYPSFDWVIVDEAAKVDPADLLIAVSQGKKILLVGDQNQLPPLIEDDRFMELQKKVDNLPLADVEGYVELTREDFKYLPFQHLFDNLPASNKGFLDTQYRMYYVIGDFVSSSFYDGLLKTDLNSRGDETRKVVMDKFHDGAPLIWLSTSKSKTRYESQPEGYSGYYNTSECELVSDSLHQILDSGDYRDDVSVIVITGYKAQLSELRKMISCDPELKGHNIKIGTVDSFQGQQADIVIMSMVRSNKRNKLGFLKEKARMNVAFSRARDLLIIVGDADFFFKNNKEEYATKMKEYFENESIEGARIIDV